MPMTATYLPARQSLRSNAGSNAATSVGKGLASASISTRSKTNESVQVRIQVVGTQATVGTHTGDSAEAEYLSN